MRRGGPLLSCAACAVAAAIGVSLPASADGPPKALPPLPPIEEARPPLPPAPELVPVPWEHHIEVGAGFAFAQMPATVDGSGAPTPVRFKPAPGFHVDLSWQVIRYLRFTMYVVEHDHGLVLPPGSLGLQGSIDGLSAHAYSFGARVSPTLPLGRRVRLWITAGGAFGRVEYGRFTFTAPNLPPVTIRERGESLFEIPVGFGGAFEIIPRWLSLHMEMIGSFVPSQIGDALMPAQYIDGNGMMQNLLPMPKLDASFVETIGLSLHL